MMRKLVRKVALGTASVLALGVAGSVPSSAIDLGNAAYAGSASVASPTSKDFLPDARIWKSDVRWAQLELRNSGLYQGSLDGILGPATRRALGKFQQDNGLNRTAALDEPTWQALTGSPGIGQGSSAAPNPSGVASDLGK